MDRRTISVSLSEAEEKLLREAMQRDGMTQISSWLKWIGNRYATGLIVPRNTYTPPDHNRPDT
jgi:hypothetical protein